MKAIWQGRMIQVAAKVGDQAPMLASGAGLCAVYAVGRFARRAVTRV